MVVEPGQSGYSELMTFLENGLSARLPMVIREINAEPGLGIIRVVVEYDGETVTFILSVTRIEVYGLEFSNAGKVEE
jgi:hypothetical protein